MLEDHLVTVSERHSPLIGLLRFFQPSKLFQGVALAVVGVGEVGVEPESFFIDTKSFFVALEAD